MSNPASILFDFAGRPPQKNCNALSPDNLCWLCGSRLSRGAPLKKWMGSNFTDQNKCRAPGSPWVCEACVWACSWVAPPGFEVPASAKRGPNLRQYTHLWSEEGGYEYRTKAEKPAIRNWLRVPRAGRWFAAVPDSGKKHLLPWTRINRGSHGLIRFEEAVVALPTGLAAGWALMDDMIDLLSIGIRKFEIGPAAYSTRTWIQHRAAVRTFENRWAPQRGSRWWTLALWLAQPREKEEKDDGETDRGATRGTAKTDCRRGARDESGVPGGRSKPAQALGSDPESDARRSPDIDERPGVDDSDGEGAAARVGEQLALF